MIAETGGDVVRMVVLVERDNPQSEIAVSRRWILSAAAFDEMEAGLRRLYGAPVQEGMRDLESRQDIYSEVEERKDG